MFIPSWNDNGKSLNKKLFITSFMLDVYIQSPILKMELTFLIHKVLNFLNDIKFLRKNNGFGSKWKVSYYIKVFLGMF